MAFWTLQNLIAITGIICLIVGLIYFNWYGVLKNNNKLLEGTNTLLKDQNAELRTSNDLLKSMNVESSTQITTMGNKLCELEGMINLLKNIPLEHIDVTMKELALAITHLLDVNNKILRRLTLDARTLSKDTTNVANAAKQVKTDLQVHDKKEGTV